MSAASSWSFFSSRRNEARALERWYASSYVERVDRVLRIPLSTRALASASRLELVNVLIALPEYWNNARISLVSLVAEWNRGAIARIDALMLLLQTQRKTFLGISRCCGAARRRSTRGGVGGGRDTVTGAGGNGG